MIGQRLLGLPFFTSPVQPSPRGRTAVTWTERTLNISKECARRKKHVERAVKKRKVS